VRVLRVPEIPEEIVRINVLGVDLAVAQWSSNGSAVISFERNADPATSRWLDVVPGAVTWPTVALTPDNMVDAICHFMIEQKIAAVSMDGPQGWRDPGTAAHLRGVGRRCEYEARTQGKTGIYGRTFPGNQRPWIEFCIRVFELLLSRGAILVDSANASNLPLPPAGQFYLLECFPTSTWKINGLPNLPAKSKNPLVNAYWQVLRTAFQLPGPAAIDDHDNLQAVVGGLPAAAALGANCGLLASGVSSTLIAATGATPKHRAEGLIWDALVPAGENENPELQAMISNLPSRGATGGGKRRAPGACQIRITQRVLENVQRIMNDPGLGNGTAELMISVRGWEDAFRGEIAFNLGGTEFAIYKNDTHACRHGSQQTDDQCSDFESVVAVLSDAPNTWIDVMKIE
jgi:hypothetical protein